MDIINLTGITAEISNTQTLRYFLKYQPVLEKRERNQPWVEETIGKRVTLQLKENVAVERF